MSKGTFRFSARRRMSLARCRVARISQAFSCPASRNTGLEVSSDKKTSCTASSASWVESRRVQASRSSMSLYSSTIRQMVSWVPAGAMILTPFTSNTVHRGGIFQGKQIFIFWGDFAACPKGRMGAMIERFRLSRRVSPCGASDFLDGQKVTKEPLGGRLRMDTSCPYSPPP